MNTHIDEETDEDSSALKIILWLYGLFFSYLIANAWTEFAPRWSDSYWADLLVRGASLVAMMFAYGKVLDLFFPLPEDASEELVDQIRGWPRVVCLGISCIVFSILFIERPLGHFMRDHYGPPSDKCRPHYCPPLKPIDNIIEFE